MRPSPLFSNIKTGEAIYDIEKASYKGIAIKTSFLLAMTIVVAILIAYFLPTILLNNPDGLYVALLVGSIVGFISVMVGRISNKAAKYCGVIYAACEGLFLGVLSAILEVYAPGVATLSIFSTLIIFSIMAVLFFSGIIRVGTVVRRLIISLGFCALALVLFVSIYTIFAGPITNVGLLLGLEAFLLIYGVFTLLLNFDEAKRVVDYGASKDAEWSVSLGLMVTLIYIYVYLIRILSVVLRNRN